MTFDEISSRVVSFFEGLEGWAVNQHQRTDDAGFAALARVAKRVKDAVVADPADLAAIGKMAAQDLPNLVKPAPPMPLDAPQPDIHVGGRPSGTDSGLMRGQ